MFRTVVLLMLLFQSVIAAAQVRTAKNINYAGNKAKKNTLNIFYQHNEVKDKPVLIFIHGGSWSSGKKETYWWLGRNFARKGIVTVIINYPLAPDAQYGKMADDCALAVKWVQQNIVNYSGSAGKIFVMGHSAGAHLSELINADPQYFQHAGITNPIRGIILNDPFGLDIHEYLTTAEKDNYYYDFLRTFTKQSAVWKLASPMAYIKNVKCPHLLFYGGKTYPSIKIQTKRFYEQLKADHVFVELKEVRGKSHVPMISQMIFGSNDLYKDIVAFIHQFD